MGLAAGFLVACQTQTPVDQPQLGSRSVPLLNVDGLQFRDLNRSGVLDPYEDWRLTPGLRARDLVARLSLAEKAGFTMHSTLKGAGGPLAAMGRSEDGYSLDAARDEILQKHITSFITRLALEAPQMAAQNNAIQEIAEAGRHGIPVTISTDPRHHFQNVAGASLNQTGFAQWPEAMGFAALGDAELMRRFADVARREYRAIGIHQALSPQADLATEPRWPRAIGTFGADPGLAREMVRAYVAGFQGGEEGLTDQGVLTVVKHGVGYGAAPNGWDGHNYYGRFADLDNSSFDLHVEPFLGAFEVGAAGVMPTYSIVRGVTVDDEPLEPVGAGFSRLMLTTLLRDRYGFDGIVLSDWAITRDCEVDTCQNPVEFQAPQYIATPWGMENATVQERIVRGLTAGIDQFGGENAVHHVFAAVRDGLIDEAVLDAIAERVLITKFNLGLFENPFVAEEGTSLVLDDPVTHDLAHRAQAHAQVLLKNDDDLLPLAPGSAIYGHGVASEAIEAAGYVAVASPEQADIVLMRMAAPHDPALHPNYFFAGIQHEGRLEYAEGDADFDAFRALPADVPRVVSVFLDRPAVLTSVAPDADVLLGNFGVSDAALLDVVAGREPALGRLPFELPVSDAAVDAQKPGLPDDSQAPLFPSGWGLGWSAAE